MNGYQLKIENVSNLEHSNPPTGTIMKQQRNKWINAKKHPPTEQKEYLCAYVFDGYDMIFYTVLQYFLICENPHFQHFGAGVDVLYYTEIEPVTNEMIKEVIPLKTDADI